MALAAWVLTPLVVDIHHAVPGVWFAELGPLSLVAVSSAFGAVGMLAHTSRLPALASRFPWRLLLPLPTAAGAVVGSSSHNSLDM